MFDEYRIVTFDIFDTLVKRNVYSPVDVFQLIEKQYNLEHTIKIKGFASERSAAEQKARSTYDNILRLVRDDPDVCEPIKFLRAREIVHFQRFGEANRTDLSKKFR